MAHHVKQLVVGAHIMGPVANVSDTVLLEQVGGMVGEPAVQRGQLAGHGLIDPKLLEIGTYLGFGRVGGQPHEAVLDAGHQGPIPFRISPHLVPVGVILKGSPFFLPVRHIVEAQDVGELVAGADHGGPESYDPDAVVFEEARRMFGKSVVECAKLSGHGVIDAQFVQQLNPPRTKRLRSNGLVPHVQDGKPGT